MHQLLSHLGVPGLRPRLFIVQATHQQRPIVLKEMRKAAAAACNFIIEKNKTKETVEGIQEKRQ